MDAIIHLAACADDADFVSRLVPANVIGVYHMLEAARLEGVGRVILASSCQAADLVGRRRKVTVEDRFPTDHYGLTKLWAEDIGKMYSWRYDLSILAVRLGWVVRSEAEMEQMISTPGGNQLFLSHHDLKEFFCRCLQADAAPFAVVYALSKQIAGAGEVFDMAPSRELIAFEPQDVFPGGLDRNMFRTGSNPD